MHQKHLFAITMIVLLNRSLWKLKPRKLFKKIEKDNDRESYENYREI